MDIMMLLDTQNVRNLRKEFEKAEDGLPLHQFVEVMKSFLKGEEEDDTDLVTNLCELFAQIDINGDGNMEWEGLLYNVYISRRSRSPAEAEL